MAGQEYLVADYIPYGDDQGVYAQFMAPQSVSGEIFAVNEDLPVSGRGLALQAVPNPFNPRVRTAEGSVAKKIVLTR